MKTNLMELAAELIPGADTRTVAEVTPEQVKDLGNNVGQLGVHAGDVLEFGTDIQVVSQPVRDGSTIMAYYVLCTRNGKPSFVSASTFYRRDAKTNEYLKDEVRQQYNSAKNFEDFYKKSLAGKTVKATDEKMTYFAQKFTPAGERVDGEYNERSAYKLIFA